MFRREHLFQIRCVLPDDDAAFHLPVLVPSAEFRARHGLDDGLALLGDDEEVFTKAALRRLKSYSWPGNVRQLKNVIEWMCIMHSLEDGECFDVQHLPPEIIGVNGENGAGQSPILQELNDMYLEIPLRDARELFEKEYLLTQVDRFEGNISQTAKFVGMERSALHRKLKSLNIGSTDEKPAEETVLEGGAATEASPDETEKAAEEEKDQSAKEKDQGKKAPEGKKEDKTKK